ncbi:Uncharacterised protein [Mycobacteroides abscessus subsp. abscessus]|nr:Uncharacterised protein [Mycobacteroides abscessus subsp. abscessus]
MAGISEENLAAPPVNIYRHISCQRHTMQLTLLLTEIGNAVVLGGPVVPHSHVT